MSNVFTQVGVKFSSQKKVGVIFTLQKKDEVKLSLQKKDGVKFMMLSSNSYMFQKSEQWWNNNEIGRQDECSTIYSIFFSVLQLYFLVYNCTTDVNDMGSTTFKEKKKR